MRTGRAAVALAALLLCCAMVLVVGATTPPRSGAAAGARVWTGPDGHAEVLAGADGTVATVETAELPGTQGWLRAPLVFALAAYEEPADVRWVRETLLGSGGQRRSVLAKESPDGLLAVAEVDGEVGAVHVPPLPLVPADLALGASWDHTGQLLLPDGTRLEHRSTSTTEPAGADRPGCLAVRTESTVADQPPQTSTVVRCPGRGPVALADSALELSAPRAGADPLAELRADVQPGAWPERWSDPDDWQVRRLPVTIEGRTLSGLPQLALLPGRPVLADGDQDLMTCLPTPDGRCERDWAVHPGGQVTGVAVVGDVLLAATSQRRLVAWRADGLRLWSRDVPDVVTSLVRTGPEAVTVTTVSGDVLTSDLRTGAVTAESRHDDPVRLPAVVGGGQVVSGDTGGVVRSGAGWIRDSGARTAALAATDELVLVLDGNGYLTALDAGTGRRRWQVRDASTAGLQVLGDTVVSTDGVAAVSTGRELATGRERWRRPAAAASRSDGRWLVLPTSTGFDLLDRTGSPAAAWAGPGVWQTSVWPWTVGPNGLLTVSELPAAGDTNELVLVGPPPPEAPS